MEDLMFKINWKKVRSVLGVQEPNTLSPAAMKRAIDKAMIQIERSERMKYKTLEELRDAYLRGDLADPIYLDNDDTFVWSDEPTDEDPEAGRVFDGGVPRDLLIEALDLLGIPSEGV